MKRVLLAALLLALPSSALAYAFISSAGCPEGTGAHWPARLLPTPWKLNVAGYSKIPFGDVVTTLKTSVGHWGEPCCSSFTSLYDGTTQNTAQTQSAENVLSFEEGSWDPRTGASTIAVTFPVTRNCEILSADMLFNGATFVFAIDGSQTDLESIATHEFGHWTGLDHSTVPGATMQAFYSGGTDNRSLEQDDIDGECALYPTTCTECTDDAGCQVGSACEAGRCRPTTCTSSTDCAQGSICRNRACLPGCRADAECTSPQQCVSGTCRSDCPICGTCTGDDDCGGAPYLCLDMGSGGRCTALCSVDVDCDGDSICDKFNVGGKTVGLCVAPVATPNDLCPATYTCALLQGCPGLWKSCATDCGKGTDLCITHDGASVCTCSCQTDGDCGAGAKCIADGSSGNVCFPDSALDPCQGVTCDPGLVCQMGSCIDPCLGVVCATNESCQGGACVSVCGAACPGTQVCDPVQKKCVAASPCDGVTCAPGLTCDPSTGNCMAPDPCQGVTCGSGEVCSGGTCLAVDPCAAVTCPAGDTCQAGTCVSDCRCSDGSVCPAGGCPQAVTYRPHQSSCSTAGGEAATGAGLLLVLALLLARPRQ